jgi:hypothetical protein
MAAVMYCPSCGAEYRPGSMVCADCRVALVTDPNAARKPDAGEAMVEMGTWPKLQAQILRRRLETAGIPVMLEAAEDDDGGPVGTIVVPETHGDFAYAVINEIDPDDEVPDTSPHAYVTRIEEHMAAIAQLLDELRTRLDELEDSPE